MWVRSHFSSPHKNIGFKPSTFLNRHLTMETKFRWIVDDQIPISNFWEQCCKNSNTWGWGLINLLPRLSKWINVSILLNISHVWHHIVSNWHLGPIGNILNLLGACLENRWNHPL
jgi:hypothetical protein